MFNDAKTLHYGSNLAKDMCRGTLVRSGSVSIGRRERVEEDHPKGEKQITAQNRDCRFYSFYPDQESQRVIDDLRKGWFCDIVLPWHYLCRQHEQKCPEFIHLGWAHCGNLNTRLGDKDLAYKKHQMVCYFFKTNKNPA